MLYNDELDHMFLLDSNRRSYVGSPIVALDFLLGDFNRSNSVSPIFQTVVSRKGITVYSYGLYRLGIGSHIWSVQPDHQSLVESSRSRSLISQITHQKEIRVYITIAP